MGIEDEVAHKAADYILIIIPGLFFCNFHNCYWRFLVGQREIKFNLYSNIVAAIFHAGFAYYLVFSLNMNIYGIGISTSLHFIVKFLMIYMFVKCSRFNEHNVLIWSKENFRNIRC